MTNDERSTNAQMTQHPERARRHSDYASHSVAARGQVIPSTLDIRHSSLARRLIATAAQLADLLPQIESADRVAVDTEADSLHCYREKLCLLQISIPGCDMIVDPLADINLAPLRDSLANKEIVLHGADYDLRLLRRNMSFVPQRIFDTVI